MEDRIVSLYGLLGFFGLGVLFLVLFLLRARRARVREELEKGERDRKIAEGIARGDLARDPVTDEVYSCCIICGGKASTFAPISGVSWMDKLPLLNRLFSLPPRYTIEDNQSDAFQYCKIHKEVAVKKLEQFHAALRAERSQFNAVQADKVAHMDAGGLHQLVIEQHKEALEALELRRERMGAVPMLPPAAPSTKRIVSTMNSSSDDDDDEPERPRLEVISGS